MYQKFIITRDGTLKFGKVYMHNHLLEYGEECTGGGLWQLDPKRDAVILYGRSFEFGPPDFDTLRYVDWQGIDGESKELLHYPLWPDTSVVKPVIVR